MTKNLLEPITKLLGSQRPLWACEFTSKHLVVAGVNSSRKKVLAKDALPLPAHSIVASLGEKNVADHQAVADNLKALMTRAGFKGHEIGIVIPDDSARISFITAESLPGSYEEREAFVRWKLKKTLPFEVDTAQVAFTVMGTRTTGDNKGTDLMVTLSPRAVVEEYEKLMQGMGYEAGYVIPSSLAALNLHTVSNEDFIFMKIAPGCIATTVFQKGRPEFYRKVPEMPLYDAIYPTLMYYQDKLGGAGISGVTLCGYDSDVRSEMSELQSKLNVPVQKLEPKTIDDIFKPALGAVEVVWANLI